MIFAGRLVLRALAAAALCAGLGACSPPRSAPAPGPPRVADERPVQLLALSGPVESREAEISSMAWYGDTLLLLPQYPARFGDVVFTLRKADILDRLDGRSNAPLTPGTMPFEAPDVERVAGFEGFEALTVVGRRIYLTIESSPDGMVGYVAEGRIEDGDHRLRVDAKSLVPMPAPARLFNMCFETLVAVDDGLLALYEANGPRANPQPVAYRFSRDLEPQGTIAMPQIEYRITDATALEGDGRFWAINSFFVRDTHLRPDVDRSVEQILPLRWTGRGIERTGEPPIRLQRVDDRTTRNWEGIVRLDDRGFLLASDKYPATLFGFVAHDFRR